MRGGRSGLACRESALSILKSLFGLCVPSSAVEPNQSTHPITESVILRVMFGVTARPHSAALATFVTSFHYQEGEIPAAFERMLPTGQIHLLVNLYEDEFRTYSGPDCADVRRTHGAALAGPRSRSAVIDTREQRCLVRVNFRLGGAAAFFPLPLSETRDQFVELDQLWGRDGAVLRERLLEARTLKTKLQVLETVLLEHLARSQRPDPAIPLAACALERGVSISQVASRLGLLPKTFVRRFRQHVGLAPKRFSRVRRLQRVLRSMGAGKSVDWAALAVDYDYSDQAHLIHDFRALTGITPSAYRPSPTGERNHVPLATSGD
jgi:AraC-like DNA-binding protein